jgi:hypothetical protein
MRHNHQKDESAKRLGKLDIGLNEPGRRMEDMSHGFRHCGILGIQLTERSERKDGSWATAG